MKNENFEFNESSKVLRSGEDLGGAKIDLNSDIGEGIGNDALIIPYISSASIACGFHAGDVNTMYETIALAIKHDVSIGTHVSYLDKNNFGRTEMNLPEEDVYELVEQQLIILKEIADLFDIKLAHVKPHGALYNQSAKDAALAKTIARAVKDFDQDLMLYGLSGSHSIKEAERLGLKTSSEVFADRSYEADGSLTPRSEPGALIEDASKAVKQVLQMVNEGTVTTVSGKTIPIIAQTICIHGDGIHAVEFAKAIHDAIQKK
ncbi:MAG: 5-oxoprolinase subunit PxpA [Chitinophagaceae bacterium]